MKENLILKDNASGRVCSEETTELFMKRNGITCDDLITLFMPLNELEWDPILGKFVPRIKEKDVYELYKEDIERERETELRNDRIELEKRFGPFEHRNRTMNPEIKRMIEEIESFFP